MKKRQRQQHKPDREERKNKLSTCARKSKRMTSMQVRQASGMSLQVPCQIQIMYFFDEGHNGCDKYAQSVNLSESCGKYATNDVQHMLWRNTYQTSNEKQIKNITATRIACVFCEREDIHPHTTLMHTHTQTYTHTHTLWNTHTLQIHL